MAKAAPGQHSFSAGEVSPLAAARVDAEQYKTGLKTCLNYVPTVLGPVTHRPGTYYAATVKDSSRKTRVKRFEFSTTQAYIIEFGHLYCRFYRDNGQITLTAQNITGITQANPAVVTYSGADTYINGDRVVITDVLGMVEVNNREFTVANVDAGANTFELSGVNSTGYGAYTSGGTVAEVYEIATPYTETDLFTLEFTQSADVLYIAHTVFAPRKLSRTAHTAWTLSTISFKDGPYLAQNTTATTLTPSAATGTGVTLTASAVTGINNDTGFQSTDVGRLIRMKETGVWGYVRITGWTSTTVVTVDVVNTLTNINPKVDWRLGAWSDTTGYPGAVTFYEDRLVFGGAPGEPHRVDGSKTGNYEDFSPTATDGVVANDNAISFTLNASSVNRVLWLMDDQYSLLIGTSGGVWAMRASLQNEALTPTNVSAKRFTGFGSKQTRAVRAGRAVLYVQREGRVVREVTYVSSGGGYSARDVSVASGHITAGGLSEFAYQQYPHEVAWAVRGDGALVGMLHALPENPDEAVRGWHRHFLGGTFGSGRAVVESCDVIPSADGTYEQLWAVVKRTINGATVRTIEYMTKFFESDVDAVEDSFFVDCGLTYTGAGATVISGLWHLNGETVTILVDGAAHPTRVVSNGKVTLDREFTTVHAGLYSNADIELLRQEAGAQDGTAQAKTQRIHDFVVRFDSTVGGKYGPDFDNLDEMIFRTNEDATGGPIALFTGDSERKTLDGKYSKAARICLRQHLPLPSTIVGVYPHLVTQDGG